MLFLYSLQIRWQKGFVTQKPYRAETSDLLTKRVRLCWWRTEVFSLNSFLVRFKENILWLCCFSCTFSCAVMKEEIRKWFQEVMMVIISNYIVGRLTSLLWVSSKYFLEECYFVLFLGMWLNFFVFIWSWR